MNGDCLSGFYINNLQRKNEYQGIDYILFPDFSFQILYILWDKLENETFIHSRLINELILRNKYISKISWFSLSFWGNLGRILKLG